MSVSFPGLPKPLTVLIVEDEVRLRELLVDVVPDMGYAATGARSGEEALRLMEAETREIVLLDLNLPAMDGLTFFETIRHRWPQTQVIVLTGFGDLDAARRAIHLDVVDFLTKPCPLDKVDLALDRARRRIAERSQRPAPEVPSTAPLETLSGDSGTLQDNERKLILAALARNGGNRTATAIELGISRRTLHYRLADYQKNGLYTS